MSLTGQRYSVPSSALEEEFAMNHVAHKTVSEKSVVENRRAALFPTYAPPEHAFTRGKDCHLYCEEETEGYLDFFAGIAVCSLGHAHPALVEVLQQQAESVWHVSNALRVPQGEALSQRLAKIAGLDRVFFTNSGTESVECGLKMMRRYHYDHGRPERERIIGVNHAFHGRTHGGICAAGNPGHTKGFIGKDERFDHVPFNDLAALKGAVNEKTAGIIMETVQGEGGIYPADASYLTAVRELCDEHGILLMLDEVQCGVGRTGKFFAYEHYGVQPDIVASAKGLGSGFPVGACIASEAVAKSMVIGTHGSTYGGNPLAMSVASKVVDIIDDQAFLSHVEKTAELLRTGLQSLVDQYPQLLKEVRGMGLMLGVECKPADANGKLVGIARKHKLLMTKAGNNTIRLLPPLVITEDHVSEALDKLGKSLAEYQAEA
ncbi:MAG: aspartate aminotransferase family protein [Pseudomonadota bacterium]